jgi:hypothetical protein
MDATIVKQITESLEKALPEVVDLVVGEKIKEATSELKKQNDELQAQVKDIATRQASSGDSEVKELHKSTARFFKSLVKKSSDFAEAKAAFLNE